MNTTRFYIAAAILSAIVITTIAMAAMTNAGFIRSSGTTRGHIQQPPSAASPVLPVSEPETVMIAGNGPLTISGQLVQEKFFSGGDGTVKMWLTLRGKQTESLDNQPRQPVDMVVVVDQSGSMEGPKMQAARQAVQQLVNRLSSADRFALFGYADNVVQYTPLLPATESNIARFQALITTIQPDGGTNLGGGLQHGIDALVRRQEAFKRGKVILISDGLANQGVTEPRALGAIASVAAEHDFAVSTVGVGDDFNEHLMTLIADRGVGNYYYLDNLDAFASVFEQEFHQSATAAAHGLNIGIPLPDGVSLVDASGYPISLDGNRAIVRYGDIGAGQTRSLFLTFQFPSHVNATYTLRDLTFEYMHQGEPYSDHFSGTFEVACVDNERTATASVDAVALYNSAYQLDNNLFETRVADQLKQGNREQALALIDEYEAQSQTLFDRIQADGKMTDDIQQLHAADQHEIAEWRTIVEETFTGSRQEVVEKQNANSKFLQFRSYKQQRSK